MMACSQTETSVQMLTIVVLSVTRSGSTWGGAGEYGLCKFTRSVLLQC